LCNGLFAFFDRVGLLLDCLPVAIHLCEGFTTRFGQSVVCPFGAIRGFGLDGFHEALLFKTMKNIIDSPSAYE